MRYLVPGPPPCPEVVAVFYIRPAEVLTLFSVEGDAQVEPQNTIVGFLTIANHSSHSLSEEASTGIISRLKTWQGNYSPTGTPRTKAYSEHVTQ